MSKTQKNHNDKSRNAQAKAQSKARKEAQKAKLEAIRKTEKES